MRRQGFSVIELLIAMGILTVVMGLVAGYFVQQSQVTRLAQARSEVQDRVRMTMQVVTQDLQLAGASRYSDPNGTIRESAVQVTCLVTFNSNGTVNRSASAPCLDADDAGNTAGVRDSLAVEYITTLRDTANACRSVAYGFSGTTLQRGDRLCGTTTSAAALLAEDILAMDVQYVCSNGRTLDTYPNNTDCPTGSTYPRLARVHLIGQSPRNTPDAPAQSFTTVSGQAVQCPAGRVCYGMTQEVLMPNLKDR